MKKLEKIDCVRMDVEGYELNVLKGMKKILSGKNAPKIIFIELHPKSLNKNKGSIEEVIDLLKFHRYTLKKAIYQRTSTYMIKEKKN